MTAIAPELEVHVLRIIAEVTAPLRLPDHPGSALRGAFFHALWRQFCVNPQAPSCQACEVRPGCPVAFLVATLDPAAARGADPPRPYVIEPPVDRHREYGPGDRLEFRLLTIGRALDHFPYLLLGAEEMGEGGVGRRIQAGDTFRRGRFALREVWAEHPLRGLQQRVFHHADRTARMPALPVTADDVAEAAARLAGTARLTIRLKTPLRLTGEPRRLVHPGELAFPLFLRRLLRRLGDLSAAYGPGPLDLPFPVLLAAAEAVALEDRTRWWDVARYSGRQGRRLPMGGLVGSFTLRGDLGPFLPALLWGELLHVGKYCVLGNGWYALEPGV